MRILTIAFAVLLVLTGANSAFAESSNTQDENGRVYEDIRIGMYDQKPPVIQEPIESDDPGHYDGPEDEDSCLADY